MFIFKKDVHQLVDRIEASFNNKLGLLGDKIDAITRVKIEENKEPTAFELLKYEHDALSASVNQMWSRINELEAILQRRNKIK